MLADDLKFKYGWYKWQDGFRQEDGFFVDRVGKVIFWPDAEGPGYILDDATAEKIGEYKKRKTEEKKEGKKSSRIFRTKRRATGKDGDGIGQAGFVQYPLIAIILVFRLLLYIPLIIIGSVVLLVEKVFPSISGSAPSSVSPGTPSDAPSNGAVEAPAEGEEIDLTRYPLVAGPRPVVQDGMVVAKAKPGFSFWMACVWTMALAFGALGLFGWLVLCWGWNGAGHIFWEAVLGLVALSFALTLFQDTFGTVRRRYASPALDYLISRIKVQDGLTLGKLAGKKDSAGEIATADDLEYGWYKWQNGCRQKDGFFVDRTGSIHFWPDTKGPGYVLDDAAAEKIGERKKREIEEKDAEKARFRRSGWMVRQLMRGPGLGRIGGAAAGPLIAAAAIIGISGLVAKTAFSSRGGAASDRAGESEESDEVDLTQYPQVAGPRPTDRDDLMVAKATPGVVFFFECLGWGVVSAGAFWLFSLLVRYWGGVGNIFWGIVFGLVLLYFAVLSPLAVYFKVSLRYSPIALEGLVSRIKVRDGLTLPKLGREKDSTLDVDIPPELQRHEDAAARRMRDFDRL